MIDLVIGNTSQQSYYYPEDYLKISSRKIDLDFLLEKEFNSVYLPFAEQRIYDKGVDFLSTNLYLTLDIVDHLIERSNKIVIFTSCELWSNCYGIIRKDTPFNFDLKNNYSTSKFLLFNEIERRREKSNLYQKVIIVHPFYFNSVRRSKYFLFGKIFDSILHKKKIEVGNLDFYRDMVHTKFFVQKCIEAREDTVLGSGRLFNVRDFVVDLYESMGLDFSEYVKEDRSLPPNDKFIRSDSEWNYSYDDLLKDTIEDLEKYKSLIEKQQK